MPAEVDPSRLDLASWERGLVLTNSRPRSVPDALHEVARAMPDHVAVDDGERELTFAEFVRATDRVASIVRSHGRDAFEPVTVVVAHGIDALVALVGVISSGRTAVPVDGRDPSERLRAIHDAAGSSLLVSDRPSAATARELGGDVRLVVLDRTDTDDGDATETLWIDPSSTAILYFTSGSTGAPKGVARSHDATVRNAVRFACAPGITPDDRVGVDGSFAFGATDLRVWGALLNGVTLCLNDFRREGARGIPRWANASGVTVMFLVPSVLRALVDAAPDARMDSVRLLTFGGETLFGGDVRRLRPLVPVGAELRNRLGSTEALIACEWVLPPEIGEGDGPVPVGRAEPWVELRVVDGDGKDVPTGEPGMLIVIDEHLSQGYWRDPQLTAERFFDLPDGRRGFRTSDVVRQRPDGVFEHLGRADDRVKVRGTMVSPEEVERALVNLDDVTAAAVVPTPGETAGSPRLVAYVVPASNATPSGWQIRRSLASRVPGHMVPSAVVLLEELPVGARGKVDRDALPPPPNPTKRPYREPAGRERELANLYAQVLAVDCVGLDDDFFELGGDSLAAIELMAAIDEHFGVELSASLLLEAPTVLQLAPRLVHKRGRTAPAVVLLHDGTGAPFFCVAGGGSPATSLRALANAIGERPCYGIQARGLEERARPDRSVEACARRYLAEVRVIQPHGPYQIGGFSFGGLVAFEMAYRLEAAGEDVSLLAILDTVAPGHRSTAREQRIARLEGASPAARVRKVPRAIAGRVQRGFELATAGLLRRRLRQYRVFFLLSQHMGDRYRPTAGFHGPALVVRASIPDPDVPRPDEPGLGWGAFLRGPVTTSEVMGGHVGIMRQPHVAMLGSELGRALDDHSYGA